MTYKLLIRKIMREDPKREWTYEEIWHEIISRFNIRPNYIRIKQLLGKMLAKGEIERIYIDGKPKREGLKYLVRYKCFPTYNINSKRG